MNNLDQSNSLNTSHWPFTKGSIFQAILNATEPLHELEVLPEVVSNFEFITEGVLVTGIGIYNSKYRLSDYTIKASDEIIHKLRTPRFICFRHCGVNVCCIDDGS